MERTIADDKGRKIVSSEILRRGLLVAVSEKLFGTTAVIDGGELLVGRDPGCRIVLADPQVSGRHCRIRCDGSSFMLEDLGSTNGTYLNRKKIRKAVPLGYGDRLVIGETIFRFFYEEEL